MSRDVTTDPDDQLTSIIKLIDNFSFVIDKNKMLYKIEDKPLFFQTKYAISTSWQLSEETDKDTQFDLNIVFIDPKNKELIGPSEKITLPKGKDKFNFNIKVDGLPATSTGKYTISAKLLLNSKIIAIGECPYEVTIK